MKGKIDAYVLWPLAKMVQQRKDARDLAPILGDLSQLKNFLRLSHLWERP